MNSEEDMIWHDIYDDIHVLWVLLFKGKCSISRLGMDNMAEISITFNSFLNRMRLPSDICKQLKTKITPTQRCFNQLLLAERAQKQQLSVEA